jgi:hypothetical protein
VHANAGAHAPKTTICWRNLMIWSSVGILVGTEVFGVALAAAWAAGGLLELGSTLQTALYGIASAGAASVMVPFMRRAATVEPLTASGLADDGSEEQR